VHIKKLQLIGFKTFAEKTEIAFCGGLTAIVGPNGCGKSNIADALLWVMGAQNPRQLRGADCRDFIFAGTDRRRPLGMAEVSLTIDNSDHALPLEFVEITITRRIFRSGENQYLINNSSCRLRDIVELFYDTGMGKGAYSFVSQNEIDAVLSVHPEDRRILFEEAAGIQRYRVKKKEALRKLEHVEANLQRVRDILYEIEQQRAPLAQQAKIARDYLTLSKRLKDIETGLLMSELQRVDSILHTQRQKHCMHKEAIERLNADLTQFEKANKDLEERLVATEQTWAQSHLKFQQALSHMQRVENELKITQERVNAAARLLATFDAELHTFEEKLRSLEKEIDTQVSSLEKAETIARNRTEALESAKSELQKREEMLVEALRRAEDRHMNLLYRAEQRAKLEVVLETTQEQLKECQAERERLEELFHQLTTELITAQQRSQILGSQLSQLQKERERLVEQRQRILKEREALREVEGHEKAALDSMQRQWTERSARLSALQEMQEAGEGYSQGVKAVLSAARSKELSGCYTPVAELLSVPVHLRIAIEVALGIAVQDLVCDTEAEAKAAIHWLKKHRAGRATFLALSLLRPPAPLSVERVKILDGLLGLASEYVGVEPKYNQVVQLLLGRVIIAENMDAAIRAAHRLHGWSRIVTCDGELLSPGGALTGGFLQRRDAHLLGRKGEMDDLKASLPILQAEMETRRRRWEEVTLRLWELSTLADETTQALADLHSQWVACERDLHATHQEAARLEAQSREIQDKLTRYLAAYDSLLTRMSQQRAALETSQIEDRRLEEAALAAKAEIEALTTQRNQAHDAVVHLEIEMGKWTEKLTELRHNILSNRGLLKQLRRAFAEKEVQRDQVAGEWKELDSKRRQLECEREEADTYRDRCEQQLTDVQAHKQHLLEEQRRLMQMIKERNAERERLTQSMHDAELSIARLEAKWNTLTQRLQEEYNISLEQALSTKGAQAFGLAIHSEVADLRRKIRALGVVNTGAAEEYERLTERYEFLLAQCTDLEQARKSLLITIKELDKSTRNTFMDTFQAVSKEFNRLFTRLFDGGETRLVLTNPHDLLETGVDIIVQPPGKKAQNLLLLSGGERALTAIALLFSFLVVRPSPFILLDEVDAPLDGANVERFVALLQEFTEKTQILIITHNPTTIEAASRWYGVTMSEPGVSRVISYRIPEEVQESGLAGVP